MTILLFVLAWVALSVPGILIWCRTYKELSLLTLLGAMSCGPGWTIAGLLISSVEITIWRRKD